MSSHEDLDRVLECASVIGSFLGRCLVRFLFRLAGGGVAPGAKCEELVSVPRAAKLLGIGTTTLREHMKRGEIKAIRVNRQWRIDRQELKDFKQRKV
jgi:excisionase family DNA binding protein